MRIQDIEEVLETIWTCAEKDETRLDVIKEKSKVKMTPEAVSFLEKENLVAYNEENVLLTFKGKQMASRIIRQHRLAERLLTDVLKMPLQDIEAPACEFEHLIAEGIADAICTILGHPKTCPHGAVIPPGKCCREARTVVKNLIVPLDKILVGAKSRVAYLQCQKHDRLHKLMSYGIAPGMEIQVHQKFPTYVVKCDQTELALEKEVASDIYVWRDS